MRELSLFTGSGGGIWASRMLGWRTVAMVERDEYCQQVLRVRQEDGDFDECPIYDNVFAFDGNPWRGRVDVLSAGFPCQPFSVAGRRLAGEDERDGWPHTARIIREVRPSIAWLENVPGLLTVDGGRYFGRVLGDLAEAGYDAVWRVLGAADVGAAHRRDRLWIYAYLLDAHGELLRQQPEPERRGDRAPLAGDDGTQGSVANPRGRRCCGAQDGKMELARGAKVIGGSPALAYAYGQGQLQSQGLEPNQRRRSSHSGGAARRALPIINSGWSFEPGVGRVADGVASRGDRIKALGNGQCPQSMVAAFLTLRAAAIGGV